MNNEPFHAIGQEWRYFSREKAIIHTLHLAQLPSYVTGSSVFITPVPPTGTGQSGFNLKSRPLPVLTPYGGIDWTNVVNNFPPLWMRGSDFSVFASGSNGFSGTIFDVNGLIQAAQDWWPATGGAFLAVAGMTSPADTFTQMSAMELQEFTSPNTNDRTNIVHKGDYFILMKGAGWGLDQFVGELSPSREPMEISTILELPYGVTIGQFSLPSPIDPTLDSYNSQSMVILRLGPL